MRLCDCFHNEQPTSDALRSQSSCRCASKATFAKVFHSLFIDDHRISLIAHHQSKSPAVGVDARQNDYLAPRTSVFARVVEEIIHELLKESRFYRNFHL